MDTSSVKQLVTKALDGISKPYTESVIEDVFVAIETNDAWLAEYNGLCVDLGQPVVNQAVGSWVSKHVGRTGSEQVPTTRTKLAESYSKLSSVVAKRSRKKITKAEAAVQMAEFARENKRSLPANIREYREKIIDLIVEGLTAPEAFAKALASERKR